MTYGIVMVGASAGGLDAVCTLLQRIPEDFGMAIVVVQHRSKDSEALCEVLQRCSALPVQDAMDKAPLLPGTVHLAPPDYHLLVEGDHCSLSLDAPELYSRPSIDVAFESAADSCGPRVVGVVLTGANQDGARGLRRIVDRGGRAVVQDPDTAEVATMPRAALRAVPDADALALEEIAAHLVRLAVPAEPPRGRRP